MRPSLKVLSIAGSKAGFNNVKVVATRKPLSPGNGVLGHFRKPFAFQSVRASTKHIRLQKLV
jgi:hypothetical protein